MPTKKTINTRTVRASAIGQQLMKDLGKKYGKRMIKSVTHVCNQTNRDYQLNIIDSHTLGGAFVFSSTTQGLKYWWPVYNKQLDITFGEEEC